MTSNKLTSIGRVAPGSYGFYMKVVAVGVVECWVEDGERAVLERATFSGADAWCRGLDHLTKMEEKYAVHNAD